MEQVRNNITANEKPDLDSNYPKKNLKNSFHNFSCMLNNYDGRMAGYSITPQACRP